MSYIIEHKHTTGDDIKFLYKNKVTGGKIEAVQIFVIKGKYPKITETRIDYSIAFKHLTLQTNEKINLSEVDVFATKEELLASLWDI